MSYTPMIAGSGLVGWQMLQSTLASQTKAFNVSAQISREASYFQERIGVVGSAEELVDDRRLLSVALAAFGMNDQIDSKYLIQRVLEEGVEDEGALANSLSDSRYAAFAEVFNFDEVISYKTQQERFAEPILDAYEERMLSDLEATLQEPQYLSDPEQAEIFRAQVVENIETTKSYFSENIGNITSATDLLLDLEMTQVALTAFGVQDRQGSMTLLTRVFEEDPMEASSLSNVLGDQSLRRMSEAFGFYDAKPTTVLQSESFARNIVEQYRWQMFEDAVGEVDSAIGSALQFQRSIPDLAASDISENAKWFNVLGSTMMRQVFETALNMPDGFSQLNIDDQVEILKEKAESRYDVTEFTDLQDDAVLNRIIHGYLLQDQIAQSSGLGSTQIALSLISTIKYE